MITSVSGLLTGSGPFASVIDVLICKLRVPGGSPRSESLSIDEWDGEEFAKEHNSVLISSLIRQPKLLLVTRSATQEDGHLIPERLLSPKSQEIRKKEDKKGDQSRSSTTFYPPKVNDPFLCNFIIISELIDFVLSFTSHPWFHFFTTEFRDRLA